MRLQWNPKSREDRHRYIAHIRERDPQAALDNDRRIKDHADKLLSETITYKAGRVPGTHELVVSKRYLLVYRVKGEMVEILRVLHTSQVIPASMAELMKDIDAAYVID